MAKKIYKEKQRVRANGMILMVIFLMGILLYSFFQSLFEHNWVFTYVEWSSLALLLLLGCFLWYLFRLKLNLAISKQGIHYKMSPWHNKKRKILWEDVHRCEIIKTPKMAQWHGGNITFNYEKRFSVSGRNGLLVTTKDGQQYFLGSRRLYALKNAVEKALKE